MSMVPLTTATADMVEGETVTLRRSVDMPNGTIPFRSMLVVRSILCDGGIPTHINLERIDGSLAISCLPIDAVRL